MSDFQDMLAADAESVFANPDEFGTTVLYTPKTPTTDNAVRNVDVFLFRPAAEKFGPTRGLVAKTQVRVSKSLIPTKPIVDGDKFTVDGALRTVTKIEDDTDPGMWHLTVS
jgi:hypothetical protein